MSLESIIESQNQNSIEVKLAKSLQYGNLSEEDKVKVKILAATIDLVDSRFVLQYGMGAQSKISNFADTILGNIRIKDSGYVGNILTNLILSVKELDIDSINPKHKSFLSKIPFIRSAIDSTKRFLTRYVKLSIEIERIIEELDKARFSLMKDILIFDKLYEKNLEYFKELELYILAGIVKIEELQTKIIPEMKVKAEEAKDQIDVQKVDDMIQVANRFEKRLYDLRLSKMISMQTAPQIRLIQNSDELLVDKIQSCILNTIPLWKNQIIIAMGLFRQNKALKLQKKITNATNELLLKNSEMLKTNSIFIAKESEKGIVDVETLKKVNSDLISVIQETLKIQEEGKVKRNKAEHDMASMEYSLKEKLISIKN